MSFAFENAPRGLGSLSSLTTNPPAFLKSKAEPRLEEMYAVKIIFSEEFMNSNVDEVLFNKIQTLLNDAVKDNDKKIKCVGSGYDLRTDNVKREVFYDMKDVKKTEEQKEKGREIIRKGRKSNARLRKEMAEAQK